ncbi:MAG: SPASM domain-containing protein [Candidatus Riflebacteria bacterium]|nr:SPASM domain-containing protein [Candidatus Riflebacteria bacterium]
MAITVMLSKYSQNGGGRVSSPGLESAISTGIVFYIDGLKNLYRRNANLVTPVTDGLTALQILHNRFKGRGIIAGFALAVPDNPEYAPIIEQAKSLGIKPVIFAAEKIVEKPISLQQQRWGLEDDSGNDTLIGAVLAQTQELTAWKTLVLIPLANLLVEAAEVYASLELYRREAFDTCFADERVSGAGWAIFSHELLIGLMRSHEDLMWARGGLAWALKKPLYPFKLGAWHCPRVRPRIAADLRLNSERMQHVLSVAADKDFATSLFSYEKWLADSGWERHFCNYAPMIIKLEPTNECHASCFNCPHSNMQRERKYLSLDLAKRFISEFSAGDDVSWVFAGMGEPLLHPDLAAMLKMVARFSVSLQTSLQLLPEDPDFPWFSLDHVRVSTDSLAKDDFDKVRPGCNWENIEKFLAFAREQKKAFPDKFPEIGISMLRHLHTEAHQLQFLRYWKQVVKPVYRENFFRWPFDLAPEPVQWYQILGEAEYGRQDSRSSKVDFTPVKRRPCRHALLSATVLANGDITICPYDFEGRHVFGNLEEQSLKQIWNSHAAEKFRFQHLEMMFSDDLPCGSCRDWYHPI